MNIYTKEECFKNGFGLHLRRQQMCRSEAEHLHEFLEIVYVLSGEGIHGIDGVEYTVRRGSLLFINYQQTHCFKTDGEMEILNVLLDPEWISEELIDSENAFELLSLTGFSAFSREIETAQPVLCFSGGERNRLERLISDMLEEQKNRDAGFETVLKAQTNILLTMIFRRMSRREGVTLGLGPEFLNYLRQRCAEKLSLTELSKSCFYNPAYFSRRFKEYYGITVTEFIARSRLDRAKTLLADTGLSVDEIVQACGFSGKNSFYRLFKEALGMTPGDYRRQVKKEYKKP